MKQKKKNKSEESKKGRFSNKSVLGEKKSDLCTFPEKTSVEAPEIIARKSALHNLTLGLGKRTF